MLRKLSQFAGLSLVLAGLLVGCAGPAATTQAPANTQVPPTTAPAAAPTDTQAPTEAPAAAPAALKITGKVANEMGWTEAEVKAMPTTQAEGKNQQGKTDTYTGVLISGLLKLAQPAADATTVAFVGEGGATAEAPLADVLACANCIVSFRNRGGFSLVMPGFADGVQLRGVTEIQVK